MSNLEPVYTKEWMTAHLANCFIGLISITFVIIGGNGMSFYSGKTCWLIGPTQAAIGHRYGKKVKH